MPDVSKENVYICKVFRKRHNILFAQLSHYELAPRIGEERANLQSKEKRHSGVDSPLICRGCARPVVGMVVCAVSHAVRLMRTYLKQIVLT